jgi:monoterpene epsilon-lactone hydrolase
VGRLKADADGTIHVPAFDLPLSSCLSSEARESLIGSLLHPALGLPDFEGIASEAQFRTQVDRFRQDLDAKFFEPFSQALLAALPVDISTTELGGVPVEIFTPQAARNDSRVLINLHGGAFFSGAVYGGRVESIPVAHLGKTKVIAVNYRQGYEHRYPAATEDVIAVYKELLKVHAPENVGLYGGSAGGRLTAQSIAWMIDKGIPVPGAAGVFGSGAGGAGDSEYFGKLGIAEEPPRAFPPTEILPAQLRSREFGYFAGVAVDDYLVTPINAPLSLLQKFPPTLIITGTRAFDLTPAILFHRALTRAQVDASLQVFEGLGHCFYYNVRLPEARDAYDTIIRFFGKHLGRRPGQGELPVRHS